MHLYTQKIQLQVESIDNIVININSAGVIFIHNHTPGFIALQTSYSIIVVHTKKKYMLHIQTFNLQVEL